MKDHVVRWFLVAVGKIPPVMETIRVAAEARSSSRGDQLKLADELNVSRNAVSTWMRGLVTPEPERWSAIEDFLGMRRGTLNRVAADYYDPTYAELRQMLVNGEIHDGRVVEAERAVESAIALAKEAQQRVADATPLVMPRPQPAKHVAAHKGSRVRPVGRSATSKSTGPRSRR